MTLLLTDMNPTLQRELINFLRPLPQFQNEQSRTALLIAAGLSEVAPSIELRGSADEFVPLLVRRLEAFGEVADSEPALVVLLRSLAQSLGQEKNAAIREFCARLLDDEPARLMARCPYRGLAAFREEDEPYFFGRDTHAAKLVKVVRQNPFVAVIGASGSGKSSLVYAGLIPQLRRQFPSSEGLHELPSSEGLGVGKWQIAMLRPLTNPFYEIASAMFPLLDPEANEIEAMRQIEQLTAALQANEITLAGIVRRIARKSPASRLLIAIDQFEELYAPENAATCRNVIEHILQLIADSSIPAHVVVTLRSDFLGQTNSHPDFSHLIADNILLVPAMNADELRAAIAEPAQKAGQPLSAEVVDLLIEQTKERKGALPLLEFALTQIWHGMTRGVEPAETLKSGGVGGMLAKRATQLFQSLDAAKQQIAHRAFLAMTQFSEVTEYLRCRATIAEMIGRRETEGEVRNVLQTFAQTDNARLITLDRDSAEITHEALFEHWGVLKNWLKEHRNDHPFRYRLTQAATHWDHHNRPTDLLWRSVLDLEQLREYSQRNKGMMTALQEDFWDASERLFKESERKKKQTRVLKQATVASLVILAAVSVVGAIWAIRSEWIAQQESQRAKQEKNKALRTQSLFLADLARQQNERQNYGDAMLLALEALPKNMKQQDRPYVLEAEVQLYHATTNMRERFVLTGHEDDVNSVAFSPDGTRIVTASDDNTARVWDALTGKELATLIGHESKVTSAAFSPDGTRIVTATGDFLSNSDKTARVWDAATGKELATLIGHEGDVNSVAFSPDGTHIVTASNDKTARVWDAATGKELAMLYGDDYSWVNSATFSPDGTRIVTASGQVLSGFVNRARVWDAATGEALATLTGHESWVHSAMFSPDGTRIVTASSDKTARVWDAATGKELATLTGHESEVTSAAFSPDGTRIITASRDNTARVWDAATGQEVATLSGHEGEVNSAAFSPDGTRIITASDDTTALVWDAATGEGLAMLIGHENSVNSVVFSPDGMRIVTASDDNTARVWEAATGQELATLTGHEYPDTMHSATFSLDGKRIVTMSGNNTVRVWDVATGKVLATQIGHESEVKSVAFTPDGTRIVTTDGTARAWEAATGKELATLTGDGYQVDSVAFSPDGTRIVTTDGTARVWDAATGKVLATLIGHESEVNSVAFSPDGTRIVTASSDGTARVWDVSTLLNTGVTTGKVLAALTCHGYKVDSAAFSPDGTRIVTASRDNTVRVWDVSTLPNTGAATVKEVATLTGHTEDINSVTFSPDGTRIVTVSDDNTARVWRAFRNTQELIDYANRIVPRRLSPEERKKYFLEE